MNLSGVPNVYLHVHTAGLLIYKCDWTQEMKLHETPHSKKHISSNRAIDSHQRPESSNLLLGIHQFHLAPWVKFSWMTTGLWYDQCWPSSQFMYLLWIVHRMIPQRGCTVWDVERSVIRNLPYPTLLFVLPFYWVSVASPSMARPIIYGRDRDINLLSIGVTEGLTSEKTSVEPRCYIFRSCWLRSLCWLHPGCQVLTTP